MAKIRVLDKHVAELIAAGEVVERPSSVIKELVENSVDAGASVITVEIRNGGISFMRVTDNGFGIEPEDVSTALLRHATSKVINGEDLDAINTLGFRGEALASISAVSSMDIITKTVNGNMGTKLSSSGGEVKEISEAGCPGGTTIIVRDLFYNVPARMKFLKKNVTEGNTIAALVDKIALSHPEISFRFIREGKEVLHTPGDNQLKSAIYAVFGKNFSNGLIPVSYEFGGIKISGFTSLPTESRPNRAMQNFFINGRWIRSRTAFVALEEAYKGMVMTGKFPSCVIHIDMNCSAVDVNVHPAKLEVRFANEKPVFDAIYHGVKSALMLGDKPKEMLIKPQLITPFKPTEAQQINISQLPRVENKPESKPIIEATTQDYIARVKQSAFMDSEKEFTPVNTVKTAMEAILDETPIPCVDYNNSIINAEAKKKIPNEVETKEDISVEETKPLPTTCNETVFEEDVLTNIIGEAFDTYIIVQYGKDKLMLIDKHAAHERLIYEKLKKTHTQGDSQSLLVPITLSLEKNDYNALIENKERLVTAGYDFDDFGDGTIIVRGIPLLMDGQDAEASLYEIAGHFAKNKLDINTETMDWVYHNIACRSAIKGGDRSNKEELIALAKELESNPNIRYCPHGRPVYVILKKREIEKEFKRIL